MLKDNLEHLKRAAAMNFEIHGELMPIFITEFDGKPTMMPLYWSGPEDKNAFSEQLHYWISSGSITEYVMVTESWVLKQKDSDPSSYRDWIATHGSLENHPDRGEMIMIQYSSPSEEIMYCAEITRDGDNATLGEWVIDSRNARNVNPANMSGRFAGMFAKSAAGLN
jgi:hypothetical protein